MKKILVVGSLNMDMVIDVDHMPAVGETHGYGSFCGSSSGTGGDDHRG